MKEKKEQNNKLVKEITKYGIAGVFNSILGITIMYVQVELLDILFELALVINYTIGYFTNYILNRKFTFKSKGNKKDQMKAAILVYIVSFLMQFLVVMYFQKLQLEFVVSISNHIYNLTPTFIVDIIGKERYLRIIDEKMLLTCLGIVIFATFNFSLSRAFTFKEKK